LLPFILRLPCQKLFTPLRRHKTRLNAWVYAKSCEPSMKWEMVSMWTMSLLIWSSERDSCLTPYSFVLHSAHRSDCLMSLNDLIPIYHHSLHREEGGTRLHWMNLRQLDLHPSKTLMHWINCIRLQGRVRGTNDASQCLVWVSFVSLW